MNVLIGSQITDDVLDNCPPGSIFNVLDRGVGMTSAIKLPDANWMQSFYADRRLQSMALTTDASHIYRMEQRLVLFMPDPDGSWGSTQWKS